jgi:hypothetical protein
MEGGGEHAQEDRREKRPTTTANPYRELREKTPIADTPH